MIQTQNAGTSPAIIAALATIATTAIALGAMGAATGTRSHETVRHYAPAKIPPATVTAAAKVKPALRHRDVACIASAIWHEAGNQPREGRIAIAEVVIARTLSGIYPKRACAVVAQPHQFSFVDRGRIPEVPSEHRTEMMDIARGVLSGALQSRVKGALWFHATYVSPHWHVPVLGRIGQHIFYGERA